MIPRVNVGSRGIAIPLTSLRRSNRFGTMLPSSFKAALGLLPFLVACSSDRPDHTPSRHTNSERAALRATSASWHWRQAEARFEANGATWRAVISGRFVELSERRSGLSLEAELKADRWSQGGTPGLLRTPNGHEVFATPSGVEDWHLVSSRQPVRFSVALGESVAGLRLVSRTLEFLDATGVPRLRMAPPYAIGADDVRHELSVAVEDCAFTADARPPQADRIIPPGSRSCSVVFELPDTLRLPARVDPAWGTTDAMAVRRLLHQAVKLKDDRLLVCGGAEASESTSCEVYDPASETWSATGNMLSGKPREFAIAALGDGRVIAPGNTASEIFDPDLGTWSSVAGMNTTREPGSFRAISLENGNVLVAGGQDGNFFPQFCETFNPTSESWVPGGLLPGAFAEYAATRLSDGRVLITGGRVIGETLDTGAVYDPAKNSWRATGKMTEAHWAHALVALPDGNAVVVAGTKYTSGRSEAYDANANTFASIADISPARQFHAAEALPDGTVLVAGGYGQDFSQPTPTTALLLPWANRWVSVGDLSEGRYQLIMASFRSATQTKVIAAGGDAGGFGTIHGSTTTNIIRGRLIGDACTSPTQCFSGTCVDGVCCDSACDGSCESCMGADTGDVDGHCGYILEGADPDDECDDASGTGCVTGSCDGAGACGILADSSVCREASCQGSQIATGTCEAGKCVNSYVDCGGFACSDAACLTSCSSDSECAADRVCAPVAGGGGGCVTHFCRDDSVLASPGGDVDCAPYACIYGSACATNCNGDEFCAYPNVCNAGKCGPKQPDQESGCGCRVPDGQPPPSTGWLLGLVLPWIRRRRRR